VTIVSNSSPLISFAKIESFHLLQQLYGSLTISAEVYAEVVVSGARLPGSSETSSSTWIQVKQVKRADDITAAQERFGLGIGELSTLILAKELEADLVILDDLGARRLAQREGFRVQGSMAVLEACFRKGFLADLRGAYEQLLKRGVFFNRELLNRSLQSFKLPRI
jgi:predicted nucleic acid-binding protein